VSDSQDQPPNGDARAGSRFLALLATPVNLDALRALEQDSTMSLVELRRAAGNCGHSRAALRLIAQSP